MIDRQTVEKIKDAANIVDVVSEFVTLRKSGANYKGLCPFHNEKTPSFIVTPSRNTCHCFGCGKGGTPVTFIMEHEQITYPEALRWLANKYHIEIVERELSDAEKEEQSNRESMFIINEFALKYFEDKEINNGENLFDISLSTQLFENRVLLGGNFGNRRFSTGGAAGDFTGNLDLQVKLDPEGKFRFNVFSHAADEFTSYLDFSQRNGIGISYQREYRTFQEFLRHLTVPARKREQYDLLEAEKQLKQVIIKIDGPRQTLSDPRSARRRGARRDSTAVRP